MPSPICSKCGARPHDGWPGDNGSEICQECWEDECSASWWRMVCGEPRTGGDNA